MTIELEPVAQAVAPARTLPGERISVVVPVYNEHLNIEACLRGLWKSLATLEHEILVCYDFDEDSTLPAIAAMADRPPSVRLVKNTLGRGAANALRAGFQASTGDVIVTTMADLSDPPEVIPTMAEKMRREKAAVVSGSRYMKGGSQTGGPLFKRFLSQSASLTLHWITGMSTHDATSNFRAYSREFIDTIRIESVQGFEIALELTVKAHLQDRKIAEVPSSWMDRTAGESRFRIWKWAPNYLRWYLRAMAAPAASLFVLAVLLGAALVRAVHDGRTQPIVTVLALGAFAAGALLVSRTLRGRNTMVDVAQPILWLLPWHLAPLGPVSVAALALTSAAWIAFTRRPGRAAR
ncbi:MAG TPA: glycosyltransferase [Planctomycetota bacterium]|nr:glycosyltransferase [Planctomycetota bacterium]